MSPSRRTETAGEVLRLEQRHIHEAAALAASVMTLHRLIRPDEFSGGRQSSEPDEGDAYLRKYRRLALAWPWRSGDRADVWIWEQEAHVLGLIETETSYRYRNRPGSGPSLYITNIAVDPEHRRRGIGGRLLARVREQARLSGMAGVVADVWGGNEASFAFFSKHGFGVRRTEFHAAP